MHFIQVILCFIDEMEALQYPFSEMRKLGLEIFCACVQSKKLIIGKMDFLTEIKLKPKHSYLLEVF